MHASVPPAKIASASPRRIISAPSPTACAPVAQAETGRVVRAAHPERDRELARRSVHEHVREEGRCDTVGAALDHDRVLLDDPDHAADRGAEDDPDARRVGHLETGVGHGLVCGAESKEHVPLEPARVLGRGDGQRIEVLHLAGDPDREPRRVEGLDEVDSALPRDRRARSRVRRGRAG